MSTTGTTALGNNSATVAVDSSSWDISAGGFATGFTLVSPTITTSPTAAGATWTDLGTVTTADINGGTIDGATIGATSASTGAFTTISATGNTTLGNATSDRSTINGELMLGSIAADPAGSDGLMYYNTTSGTFRCYAAGAWQACGSTLTGSGAAGRVTFWDGATSLASSTNLNWDDATGRLGIGTTTPESALHVVGDVQLSNGAAIKLLS